MECFVTTGSEQPAWDAVVVDAINGNRPAMDALWQEHRRWVAAVLLAHKSPEDQLEDLLQDVAMTIVGKINTVRETHHVRAWLRTVAVNVARASARTRRARPKLAPLSVEPPGPDHTGPAAVGVDDEARRLMDLAGRLPVSYREPLMLRAIYGMRGRHIAEILDLSEATVETRISRARRMLRDLARDDEPDDYAPVAIAGLE
jgi:RNA polymerase sigma-70 factor (ECF subfamily)